MIFQSATLTAFRKVALASTHLVAISACTHTGSATLDTMNAAN